MFQSCTLNRGACTAIQRACWLAALFVSCDPGCLPVPGDSPAPRLQRHQCGCYPKLVPWGLHLMSYIQYLPQKFVLLPWNGASPHYVHHGPAGYIQYRKQCYCYMMEQLKRWTSKPGGIHMEHQLVLIMCLLDLSNLSLRSCVEVCQWWASDTMKWDKQEWGRFVLQIKIDIFWKSQDTFFLLFYGNFP